MGISDILSLDTEKQSKVYRKLAKELLRSLSTHNTISSAE
jgi:hypothetical protein